MKNKVILIYIYFGKLPSLFEIWKKTIKYSKNVDICFITDQNSELHGSNIRIIKMNLDELKERISSALGINISLNNAYKICDYRPMFGIIFADLIQGYSHWGYGDLDVVWGSFDKFITDELLDNYERISKYGHLSIYKNNSIMNNLYKSELDGECPYLNVTQSPENNTFDEWWDKKGIENIALNRNIKEYYELPIADVQRIYRKTKMCYKFEMNSIPLTDEYDRVFKFINGELYSCLIKNKQHLVSVDEIIYAHFQKRKIIFNNSTIENEFWIVPNKVLYGELKDVLDYLKSEEYRLDYENEARLFVDFRKKHPNVF